MLRIVRQPLAEAKPESLPRVPPLLQLRVLGLGFLQDGNVGVGVFPEGEEIFVGAARTPFRIVGTLLFPNHLIEVVVTNVVAT